MIYSLFLWLGKLVNISQKGLRVLGLRLLLAFLILLGLVVGLLRKERLMGLRSKRGIMIELRM